MYLIGWETSNYVAESWDRRESNLKQRVHLLTAAELKRRGITRYDAEMLLSQGLSLPEPKTTTPSPTASSHRSPATGGSTKSRLKSSTPVRSSPRTQSRVLPLSSTKSNQPGPMSIAATMKSSPKSAKSSLVPSGSLLKTGTALTGAMLESSPLSAGTMLIKSNPTSAGSRRRKSAVARKRSSSFVRRNPKRRRLSTRLRTASRRRLKFPAGKYGVSRVLRNRLRLRRRQPVVKRDLSVDWHMDFGLDNEDDGDDSNLESSSVRCGFGGRRAGEMDLSMSCDDVVDSVSNSDLWLPRGTAAGVKLDSPTCTETVLTPSKLRTRPRWALVETATQPLDEHIRLSDNHTRPSDDRMPMLKKESVTSSNPSVATSNTGPVQRQIRLRSDRRGDDMPVLVKEPDEPVSPLRPDSSADVDKCVSPQRSGSDVDRHKFASPLRQDTDAGMDKSISRLQPGSNVVEERSVSPQRRDRSLHRDKPVSPFQPGSSVDRDKRVSPQLRQDSSLDGGWTLAMDDHKSSVVQRCRRHRLDVADRRYGYDTREWRVPKLTIRRRQASGQFTLGNSSGQLSSTSSALSGSGTLIYEILPTRTGNDWQFLACLPSISLSVMHVSWLNSQSTRTGNDWWFLACLPSVYVFVTHVLQLIGVS